MSHLAGSISEAVQRLSRHDPTLKSIYLFDKQFTDAELAELVDCLLAHPDVVTGVMMSFNQLTDETGVKLARYVAASSTVRFLNLSDNRLGSATYLALAAALRVNSSLQELYLFDNQAVDQARIDAALVQAMWLNPDRPADSDWQLYSYGISDADFNRLKDAAEQLGHPTLQLLLLHDDQLTAALRN